MVITKHPPIPPSPNPQSTIRNNLTLYFAQKEQMFYIGY